jgi:hypothetical protein
MEKFKTEEATFNRARKLLMATYETCVYVYLIRHWYCINYDAGRPVPLLQQWPRRQWIRRRTISKPYSKETSPMTHLSPTTTRGKTTYGPRYVVAALFTSFPHLPFHAVFPCAMLLTDLFACSAPPYRQFMCVP